MRRWRLLLVLTITGWIVLLAVRCHLPRQTAGSTDSRDSTSAVYLVRHGWHAGIAIQRADIPPTRWPILDSFPDARYLEVGWGEVRYYPGDTRGIWGAFRAGAWPTGSVLHIVPVSESVSATFQENTVVRVPINPAALDALTQYVAASYKLNNAGNAIPAADGYYPGSQFYKSGISYHVFNNCNHWAAGALEAAGCDTSPRWTFTVGQVVRQARECGTLLQQRKQTE